ncbi:uncharacterized protein LOC135126502 [Zophobas morio]|uniref:uncharacterized protein LOC135126502 n=1 Tax=Zophobas morio TaxID=2755281 RepID=UPI003083D7D7
MDRFLLRSKSSSSMDDNKHYSFHDTILRKFKFIKTLKNYVLSKIRSAKYDLGNGSHQEVSVISYDQRSFTDVEKEFDLQTSVKVDTQAVQNLKKVLNESLHNKNVQNSTYLELLEIAEKTFARQLDIFEGILTILNAKNSENNCVQKKQKQLVASFINDESIDAFAESIVKNLINEITKSISGTGQRSVEGKLNAEIEEDLGYSYQIKQAKVRTSRAED